MNSKYKCLDGINRDKLIEEYLNTEERIRVVSGFMAPLEKELETLKNKRAALRNQISGIGFLALHKTKKK